RWFDDLWLKEGFAEFMAYKTLEKVMPEYNAWKIFYERNKQAAYLTDATRGTTPIYQEIPNLSAAKSAYGNIVYRKAPSFLRQAEFYLGEDKFQTAVRAFLKKHEFKNAEWTDLVKEFETYGGYDKGGLKQWSEKWVTKPGLPIIKLLEENGNYKCPSIHGKKFCPYGQINALNRNDEWWMETRILVIHDGGEKDIVDSGLAKSKSYDELEAFPDTLMIPVGWNVQFTFVNYQDYGYGIFLLDERSRAYVLENIQTEKDDFLRTMMWGALWDSVRETELAPKDYVALVIKNIAVESDESTIQTLLGRVSTAMNYYLNHKQRDELLPQIETLLIDKMKNAPTLGLRITFARAFLNIASTEKARTVLKDILSGKFVIEGFNCRGASCGQLPQMTTNAPVANQNTNQQDSPFHSDNRGASLFVLKSKDKFDIITKLAILGDADAPRLLVDLQKTETGDDAKRYAYAANAGFATTDNKQKFFNDFTVNKEISESWIEAAFVPFNSVRHSDLTLPYLEKALAELPNLKRNRKIFFINGWLAAFIGGQKSEQALAIVNKFLADNPNLDKDLRLKILENADGLERAVKIRAKYEKN
ncbi:MAG: M1 family metallopeptidase, partial [Acidobacteriota bacterium]|nr:M1 family metallopeptidase [Acidobacteriota bacterium]